MRIKALNGMSADWDWIDLVLVATGVLAGVVLYGCIGGWISLFAGRNGVPIPLLLLATATSGVAVAAAVWFVHGKIRDGL